MTRKKAKNIFNSCSLSLKSPPIIPMLYIIIIYLIIYNATLILADYIFNLPTVHLDSELMYIMGYRLSSLKKCEQKLSIQKT